VKPHHYLRDALLDYVRAASVAERPLVASRMPFRMVSAKSSRLNRVSAQASILVRFTVYEKGVHGSTFVPQIMTGVTCQGHGPVEA